MPKLPAPKEEDLSKGILESIDMDSYRAEKQAARKMQLPDADAEIEPLPTTGGGRKPEPELDRLSNILKTFNDQFGSIPWTDADRVHRLITREIPTKVASDNAYQNARKNSDKQNARIEHDKALARVMTAVFKDDIELFKQFSDNESFRKWLTDTVFALTMGDECQDHFPITCPYCGEAVEIYLEPDIEGSLQVWFDGENRRVAVTLLTAPIGPTANVGRRARTKAQFFLAPDFHDANLTDPPWDWRKDAT